MLDTEALQLSLLALVKMATRVDEHVRIMKKKVKRLANFVVQSCLHMHILGGPESEEICNLSEKWKSFEKQLRKPSI